MTTINLTDYTDIEKELTDEDLQLCKKLQKSINDKNTDTDIFFVNDINGDPSDKKCPKVFGYFQDHYWTQGYVGFITDTEGNRFVIRSRFDSGDEQYFLQYVFEKALGIRAKIFEKMKLDSSPETTFDLLLMMLFVSQLKAALKKGLFRQYRRFEYNDSRFHGSIDIARHIRLNPLENGKIATSSREYTSNNSINCLILTALDLMKRKYRNIINKLLQGEHEVKTTLTILAQQNTNAESVKIPTLLKATERKIVHPVYRGYEQLRQTSRIIIRHLGLNSFNGGKNKVSGILIDMPMLWEDFLQETLFNSFDAKPQIDYSILGGKRTITPDFFIDGNFIDGNNRIVIDAKYRKAWEGTVSQEGVTNDKIWDGVRNDVFQVMAYMLSLECKYGGTAFPIQGEKLKYIIKTFSVYPNNLNALDGNRPERTFFTLPIYIPKYDNKSYREFSAEFDGNLKKISEKFKELIESK